MNEPVRPPTLADVAGLTPDSDYAAYAAPQVDARVRNLALKKLFHTHPHFQAGDGLDAHADPASAAEGSPLARQHQILQARALGLLDDELLAQDEPVAPPPHASAASPAAPETEDRDP